jgi:DNA polymerase
MQPTLFPHRDQLPPPVLYDIPEAKNWNGLVLVGEAPGAEEVRLGHPFVGRSGQLLDGILADAGIVRADCVVANVFRLQPPANKIDTFFASKAKSKRENTPIDEKWGQFGSLWCKSEFSNEINILSVFLNKWHPKAILALGRTPLWALTGENELLKKVGKTYDCRLIRGVPVFPTFHPSYILRGNWNKKNDWLAHILAAKQQAELNSAPK